MRSTSVRIVAAFAAACAFALLTGCASSDRTAATSSAEQADHNADDVAFARNMVPHHEQAVEMAQMVPTNTTNQQIIDMANQVISTQLPEAQAYRAWLMQVQDTQGPDPGSNGGTPMAGMVDQATMNELQSLRGAAFDRLWLTSMIDHHRGSVAMAREEVAHGKNPDVIYLAKSVVAEQQAEIDKMKRMLGG